MSSTAADHGIWVISRGYEGWLGLAAFESFAPMRWDKSLAEQKAKTLRAADPKGRFDVHPAPEELTWNEQVWKSWKGLGAPPA